MIDFALGRLGATIWNLDLRLAATEQAGKGKVISAPRVLTMDHVKATISQGTQIPYQEQSEDGISTEFKDATLELQVTPHVTPDGRVRLELQAKKEQPNFVEVIPGQPPAIDTRKIDTELLVEDGHTVVIGGIIEESDEERESRTPGIHKVPLLGRLFKSNTSRLEKNELLIFINPKVVDISGRMTSGGRPGNNLDFVTSGY
jgi:type IV pilus assembly protein PilQ